jgi:hypothetical protein
VLKTLAYLSSLGNFKPMQISTPELIFDIAIAFSETNYLSSLKASCFKASAVILLFKPS